MASNISMPITKTVNVSIPRTNTAISKFSIAAHAGRFGPPELVFISIKISIKIAHTANMIEISITYLSAFRIIHQIDSIHKIASIPKLTISPVSIRPCSPSAARNYSRCLVHYRNNFLVINRLDGNVLVMKIVLPIRPIR